MKIKIEQKGYIEKREKDLRGYGLIFRSLGGHNIFEVVTTLSPREQKILKIRFGLEDGVPHTLEEVGKEFGVTRERIRQIEFAALDKIADYIYEHKLINN